MGFLKKTKKEITEASRRKRLRGDKPVTLNTLDIKTILTSLTVLAFCGLLVFVCFVGLSPAGPQILPNQVARTRIVAEIPFSYESEILTDQLVEQRRKRVPPIYRLSTEPYERFEKYIHRLSAALEKLEEELKSAPAEGRINLVQEFVNNFEPRGSYNLNSENIDVLLTEADSESRSVILSEGLMILREIYREGVYDDEHAKIQAESGGLSFFDIQRDSGHIAKVEVQSEEDGLRFLRINLSFLDISRELSVTVYRLLRKGLTPNLVYDQKRSEKKIAEVTKGIDPVSISVTEGQTIIEPGLKVTPIDIERLNAYRQKLKVESDISLAFNSLLWDRLLMSIAVLLAAALYLRVGSQELRERHHEYLLAAVVILLNLAIIRLILEVGEASVISDGRFDLTAVLPYLAPTALGPILVAILIGPRQGVFVAVLISIFNSIMQGSSITILLVSILSSLVSIYFCRDVQVRARVVRAGAFSGLSVAVCAFFLGLRDVLDFVTIGEQIFVSLFVGVVTGIAVVGFLPVLEHLFKLTTDISLLELTDFNHPLLRRMQVAAPGSYHHSLMVANLSENAAAAVGANPLACRVCSLFHDIGKTIKPDYFTENQQQGVNPHLEKNPSMSALVIKSHVREGVHLARGCKLPKLIVDVIKQHHGTSLIQYFYYKALREKEKGSTPPFFPGAPKIELDKVNENTYRYDGPKPRFKESAIIFFADSIEAASRSLRKVTPQSIQDLLDQMFQERLDDNQLSDCALTFEEVKEIKKSFSFTLLNMLHARVVYPSKKEQIQAERVAQSKVQKDTRRRARKFQKIPSETPHPSRPKSALKAAASYAEAREKASSHSGNQPA